MSDDTLAAHTALPPENQVVVDAAIRGCSPTKLDDGDGGIYSVVVPAGGTVRVIDLDTDAIRPEPRRKTGTVHVQDANSFGIYLGKHGAKNATEVYADIVGHKVVGVLNGHAQSATAAGWGDHRVEFTVQATKEWKDWLSNDGKYLSQVEFAEFLEDHVSDLNEPAAADMLSIAESITGTKNVTWESTKRLSNGSVALEYREDVTAEAKTSNKDAVEVPKEFTIAVRPFEGSAPYSVTARFRYRIANGNLTLAYKLVEPHLRIDDAFNNIVDDIKANVGDVPVLVGTPAPPVTAASPRS